MKRYIIYKVTIGLILLCIGLLPFINVPISTSSRGFVRPMIEDTKIICVVNGRVVYSKILNNNQFVNAGDTLLIITSEHLGAKKETQQAISFDYETQLEDLNKLVRREYKGLETGLFQKELSAMRVKVAELRSHLALAKKEFDRSKLLLNQGVISQAEYEKAYFNYQNLRSQVSSVQEQQMAQWQSRKREIERQLESIRGDISQLNIEEENYVIRAPISGRLVNIAGIQTGNFIVQGQSVVEISSEDNLIAECLVSPNDIGLIQKGQKVLYQMDAFNYNQWGMVEGKVLDIDQNLITNEGGEMYFKVLCSMNKSYLELKNGYRGEIRKGSTYTARFYLLDRTLWQLLFDRVDDWFNPNLA